MRILKKIAYLLSLFDRFGFSLLRLEGENFYILSEMEISCRNRKKKRKWSLSPKKTFIENNAIAVWINKHFSDLQTLVCNTRTRMNEWMNEGPMWESFLEFIFSSSSYQIAFLWRCWCWSSKSIRTVIFFFWMPKTSIELEEEI